MTPSLERKLTGFILTLMILMPALDAQAKWALLHRDDFVKSSEFVALAHLTDVTPQKSGDWHNQAAHFELVRNVRGTLPPKFVVAGAKTAICAPFADFSGSPHGLYLLFLRRSGDAYVDVNGPQSALPVKEGKVFWFKDADSYAHVEMSVDDVLRQVGRIATDVNVGVELKVSPVKNALAAEIHIRNAERLVPISIEHPANRNALGFTVRDDQGRLVTPVGIGKADPRDKNISLQPGQTFTHKVEPFVKEGQVLMFPYITDTAFYGYALEKGKTYRLFVVYRPRGLGRDTKVFTSNEVSFKYE